MSKKCLILASCVGTLCLSACTHLDDPIALDTGRATANNLRAQIIEPTPAEGLPQTDPALSQAAIERLRSGEINSEGSGDEGISLPVFELSSGS